MKFGWKQIVLFASTMALLGWIIYPNELFLGLMNRTRTDRTIAIGHFLKYLEKNPYHKKATLFLSEVYESVGDSQSAAHFLEYLYENRRGDIELGKKYLDLLNRAGFQQKALKFRWQFFKDLTSKPDRPDGFVNSLLYEYYQSVVLLEQEDLQIEALKELQTYSENPKAFHHILMKIYVEKKDYQSAEKLLETALNNTPNELEVRLTLISVLRLAKKDQSALEIAREGLRLMPDNEHLLNQRASLYEFRKEFDHAAEDLLILTRKKPQDHDLKRRLAYDLSKDGQWDEALSIYEELIQKNPKKSKSWWELIYTLEEAGRLKDAIEWLKKYRTQFPEDTQALKSIVNLYEMLEQPQEAIPILKEIIKKEPQNTKIIELLANIYIKSKQEALVPSLYKKIIKEQPQNKRIWWALIYFHYDRGQLEKSFDWVEKYVQKFPDDVNGLKTLASMSISEDQQKRSAIAIENYVQSHPYERSWALSLAEIYEDQEAWKKADELYGRWHDIEPSSSVWLVRLARVNQKMGEEVAAHEYYRSWLILDEQDPVILKEIGMESFFSGFYETAETALEQASKLEPRDGEVQFFLGELYWAQSQHSKAREHSGQAEKLLSSSTNSIRMLLKSKARVKWSKDVQNKYVKALREYSKDSELHTDWIEVALQHRDLKTARQGIKLFERRFPNRQRDAAIFNFQTAILAEDWPRAVWIAKKKIKLQEKERSLKKDLAFAFEQMGSWQKAEKILSQIPIEPGDPLKIEEMLKDLRTRHSDTLSAEVGNAQLSSEEIWETALAYERFLTERIQLKARLKNSWYEATPKNFKDQILNTWVQLETESTSGLGGAISLEGFTGGLNDQFSPGLVGFWKKEDKFSIRVEGHLQRLWSEFATAVAEGTLADEMLLETEFWLSPKWLSSLTVEWIRYKTLQGFQATRRNLVPSIFWVGSFMPYISLGYQLFLDEVSASTDFSNQISLIPSSQTHYLTLNMSYPWKAKRLKGDIYLYNGQDFQRKLNFFKGNLFGGLAKLEWEPKPWISVIPSYEYGREQSSGVGGESHTFFLKIKGRWYNHGEKDISPR